MASAQVVLDGKLGASTTLAGPNFDIPASLGTVHGNNLFHSFSQLNLSSGEVATFSGPVNIQNILSRVTGGAASTIDGTLRSSISGANFFLINPNGIVFGPNAAIDVSGSFAASTANYLKLADGAHFLASLDADDSALSSAPVSAFGFLGSSPAALSVNQSTLAVGAGQTVSLVGGTLTVDGGLIQAPGGRINAVSVASPGEVPVDPRSVTLPDFSTAFPTQGDIALTTGARLDANGDGGGRIVIRGGHLTVDDSKIQANTTGATDGQGVDIGVTGAFDLLNGGQVSSQSTLGLGSGGDIQITAGSIHIDGAGRVDDSFQPLTQISTATGDLFDGGGSGRGGDVVIHTGNLDISNSAQISSSSFGAGNAGNIDITASSVRIDALLSTTTQISANSQQIAGGGNAGNISLHTGTLDMLNGATLLAATFGSGVAGNVDVTADAVSLKTGAIITAATFGAGAGGNVHVTTGTLDINGLDAVNGAPDYLTGIQAVTTSFDDPAAAGTLLVTADTVNLQHNGSLFTTTYGIGAGGNINVNTRQLLLGNGASIRAASESDGAAGQITLSATKDVELTGNSAVSTSALFSSGGNIGISAGENIRILDSQVTAQAGPGGGGNISLQAPIKIYQRNATVTAQAIGDGGNLDIDPIFFVLDNSSLISRSSSANGGNISILSDFFFQSGSSIDASAPFGLPGTVSVSAPEVDLSGSLIGLSGDLMDAENQLRPDCGVRLMGNVSSFMVLGRGGLPIAPGGFVPSGIASPPANEKK